jgi:rare lipoprotein A
MQKLILIFLFSAQIFAAEGFATYYTEESCKREGTSGVWTANGEKFDEKALTCAMRSREWGATFEVTNLENGKVILVRLNDFGPGVGPTARGVIIDLTPAGMKALGAKGRVKVKVVKIREPTKK